MRITIDIDDEWLARAGELTGIDDPETLVREGLHALIERESARRLARLGGSDPDVGSIRRRRMPAE